MTHSPWRFCLAPMMDWSDRHCRYLWRIMSSNARLYTEMVTTGAILMGDRQRFLAFDNAEHPVALQLGGSSPKALADCTKIATEAGFDEINLNCGCPSDRVQNGKIGACLMAEPELVAECLGAMRDATHLPVTVKHRIGIDDQDSWEHLNQFVKTLAPVCDVFIVHARKAWLQGLSPKENREIPPLDYQRVIELKNTFADKTIVINGGLTNLSHCSELLQSVDGVMMGREAYHNPYVLAGVDKELFSVSDNTLDRDEVLEEFIDYCKAQIRAGSRLNHMSRHILGLYLGQAGGRKFRRYLSENATKPGADHTTLTKARAAMEAKPSHASPSNFS